MSWKKWQRQLAALGAALAFGTGTAWAQHGYMSAPILSPSAAHSLDKAILVIGIPPLMIFIGIFLYFRHRKPSSRRP